MIATLRKGRRRRRARKPPALGHAERSLRALLLVAVAALLVRGLVAMPRSVPSESMLPGLLPGDYMLVDRWRYGWSHTSLPFGWPNLPGRLFARSPKRGDVVVFRTAGGGGTDYVKRLIGLPGDSVALRAGRLILNGASVPRTRVADFVAPLSPNLGCHGPSQPPYGRTRDKAGRTICRLPRYAETLPGARRYTVIDQGETLQDDAGPFVVPAGHYFLLGDNRDASADSRFGSEAGGIGMVPADEVEGPAAAILLSVDGGAGWFEPWAWPHAVRRARIGAPIA